MAFRIDSGVIHKSEKTREGFLRFYANFSKVGALRYLKADGTVQVEHVTADELFRDDSLETASLQPITLKHPEGGLVTPENSREYQRGLTGDRIIKNYPYATIVGVATDRETIDAIESGTNQISAGYTCKVRQRSDGTYEQYDRVYNHIAVVPVGRAGADVCIHLDSEDDIAVQIDEGMTEATNIESTLIDRKDSTPMAIVTLGNRTYSIEGNDASLLADAIADTLTTHTSALSSAQTQATEATQRADSAEGKLAAVTAEKEQLAAKLSEAESSRMDADQVSTEVNARLDAWGKVLPVLRADKADFQPDYSLPVAEIQKLAIAAKLPHLKLDGKSVEFINGVWETIEPSLSQVERKDSSQDLLELVQESQRSDSAAMGKSKGTNQITARRKERSKKLA